MTSWLSSSRRSYGWWLLALPPATLVLVADYLQYARVIGFRQAFVSTLLGLGLLLALLFWMEASPFWPRRMIENRRQLLAVLVLVVVGAAARLYRFEVFPPADGQLWEEAQLGATALTGMRNGGLDSYQPLTDLTAQAGFRWLGVSMLSMRIPFVILGIASVPLFFVTARLFLRSFFAAWFATGLFATSALLAAAARVAFETMSPIVTECLALAATFYACPRRTRAAFALAGFANGLLLTEYFGYKIVPVYSAVLLMALLPRDPVGPSCSDIRTPWRLRHLSRWLPHLAIATAFGVLLVLPVILVDPDAPLMPFLEGFARHRVALQGAAASSGAGRALWAALDRVWQMATFVFVGGGGGDDLLPASQGAIEFFTGVLGLLAAVYCLLGVSRSPAKLFAVTSIVLTVILSGVLTQNPSRYRLLPLVPIWFLVIGIAVDDCLAVRSRWRPALAGVLVAVLGVIAGLNGHNLFVKAMADREVQVNFYDVCMVLAKEIARVQREDPQAMVYLLSRQTQLGEINDYYFLYDYQRVTAVGSLDGLADTRGYLVADNEFVDRAASFARATDCRRWRTPFNDEIVSCRLLAPAAQHPG